MRRLAALAALAALALCALSCADNEATISFGLVFPPGTDRLPAEATTVRLTLDTPATVVEGPVAADGSFDVSLAVPASGDSGSVTVEALDATGAVLARGKSPPLPLALYDARLKIFVAPPGRFSEAPVSLDPPRSYVGVSALPYGFLVAGGKLADGTPTADVEVYSAYLHELTPGEGLPEARWGVIAAQGDFDIVYMLGGATADGEATAIYRFDTNVAPDGDYTTLPATLTTRAGQEAGIGLDRFIVSRWDDLPLLFDGIAGTVTTLGSDCGADQTGAMTTADAQQRLFVVLVSAAQVAVYDAAGDSCVLPPLPSIDDGADASALVRLPDGDVLAIGGVSEADPSVHRTALRVTTTGQVTQIPLLARGRLAPSAAIAGGVLVVAGGFDDLGAPLDDAELFDATTLAPLGTTPLAAPRGHARALTLPNDSIVLIGGLDHDDRLGDPANPVGKIELFTP